ncbi:MAG TPA: AAA family ATPase, partial [Leptospiraceae bacterium]|nr:AAA family ATPase [Leptospiraceae bacterium]
GYINNFWGKLDFPYIVKEFTDKTREILKSSDDIFPNSGKLITELRELIDQYIYRGSLLKKKKGIIDSLSLTPKGMKPEEGLPIPVWSAGQREFFPLLVGLYHLLPSGGISRKDFIQTVIIEEPEMGLHPSAVVAVMLVILSLLYRNYQVILSTHSPVLLDVIWGIRKLREFGGTYKDFKEMFDLHNDRFKHIYGTLSDKKFQMKTYLFHPDEDGTAAKDISELEPGSEDEIIAKWGGLTDFTDRITQTVMKMGSRS